MKAGVAPSWSLSWNGCGFEAASGATKSRRSQFRSGVPTEETMPHGTDDERQEKTSSFPSGDHEGCSHDQLESFVICRRWEPSAFTTKISWRLGATVWSKAISFPFGDHAGELLSRPGSVKGTSCEPSALATWTAQTARGCSREKASFLPSGDQAGVRAFRNSRRGSPWPFAGSRKIPERIGSSPGPGRFTQASGIQATASILPSGDHAALKMTGSSRRSR